MRFCIVLRSSGLSVVPDCVGGLGGLKPHFDPRRDHASQKRDPAFSQAGSRFWQDSRRDPASEKRDEAGSEAGFETSGGDQNPWASVIIPIFLPE